MSYDLGYEFGYESDWAAVPAKNELEASSAAYVTVYRMNGPTGPAAPGSFDIQRYMEMFRSNLPDPSAPPGAAPAAARPAPDSLPASSGPSGASASGALSGMGGSPPSPGSLPSAAPEGTPTLSGPEVRARHSDARWEGVRTELRDHYGFTDDEITVFENQHRDVSDPSSLRSGANPLLPPHEGDAPARSALTGAARSEREVAANGIRRRVAEGMVHREGGRIHGMFAEGEITRDSADAMAAQMYRRAGVDPDANPITLTAMARATTRPSATEASPIDREMTSLRGSSIQPPNPREPSSGLHRTDSQVRPLVSETVGHYRSRANERLAPLLGNSPGTGGYYGNNAAGRTHRTADASLMLVHRGVDQNPGELRRIAKTEVPAPASGTPAASRPPHPLQGEVDTFASSLGTTGAGRSSTDFRRGLETRLASDPTLQPDTSGWSAADRSGYARSVAEMRARNGLENEINIAREGREETRLVAREGREETRTVAREERELARGLVQARHQHELSITQQHDQQLDQKVQIGMNQGFQIMQSQIQHTNQLTQRQIEGIAQATAQMNQAGLELAREFVRSMSGGGGRR